MSDVESPPEDYVSWQLVGFPGLVWGIGGPDMGLAFYSQVSVPNSPEGLLDLAIFGRRQAVANGAKEFWIISESNTVSAVYREGADGWDLLA